MSAQEMVTTGALYYPYIHIRDLDWLKANLLIFPSVTRMIPMDFIPDDSDGVRELAQRLDDKLALLQPADLWSDRPIQAQSILASKLRLDAENREFVTHYGQQEARKLVNDSDHGFQIHAMKLSEELKSVLAESRLAWDPLSPEPYDGHSEYVEVHPRVGEAVMSTLAIACAQAGGLDIVGDERSGPLHRCLLEKDLDAIYDTWLDSSRQMKMREPDAATGEELFEFILGITGDLSSLSSEQLRGIAEEREPIRDLIKALRIRAAQIPAMDPGEKRDDAFKQAASEIMNKWNNDRNNLSGFLRDFFSVDAANLTTSFASKVADKTLTGMAAGAAAKASATAASGAGTSWLGSLAAGGVVGAGAGLVIGLVAHAGKTYYKRSQLAKNSPYRYLTTLEDAGVVLRSEAISHV
ncbi:MAG: hypothetical protein MPJ50_05905 [Pirellulales bacterium]|nr:hypothetical protein [Pirellulales bacterium]